MRSKYTPTPDRLVKMLAHDFPEEIASLVLQDCRIIRCESAGGEVEVSHQLTDRVFKVTAQGEEHPPETFLLHLEFQAEYRSELGSRLAAYGAGLSHREKLPVTQVVWIVGDEKPPRWQRGSLWRDAEQTTTVPGQRRMHHWWRELWLPGALTAESLLRDGPPFPITSRG